MKIDGLIFLIGFMGCGKSYWGARLAAATGLPFYDLDNLIETAASDKIAHIFAQAGEEHFRQLERQSLLQCDKLSPAIVATGGGTPCFFDNMAWMNHNGRTIYLKTPANVLAERLRQELGFRPLLANVEPHLLADHIDMLLLHREPFYRQATVTMEQKTEENALFEKMLLNVINA